MPEVVASADIAFALAYCAMAAVPIYIARRRPDFPLSSLTALFVASLLACGASRFIDVGTAWSATDSWVAVSRIASAALALLSAILLWSLIPRILALPTALTQRSLADELQAEGAVRRLAERDLLHARGNLQVALAALGAGFVLTDRRGNIVQMNELAQSITGWSVDEVRGLSVQQIFRREGRTLKDLDGTLSDFIDSHVAAAGEPHQEQLHVRDGTVLPVATTVSILRDPDGQTQGIGVMFRDRSDVLKSEAENRRLAALVESSRDAIISCSLDGKVTSWNRAAEVMFGRSAAQALGHRFTALAHFAETSVPTGSTEEIVHGESQVPGERMRYAKDGTLVVISELVSPVKDSKGHIVGVSHILRDVSVQRRVEKIRAEKLRLRAENERILATSRMKSAFVATMSHELRTPLNAIIGFSSLLSMDVSALTDEKRRQFLGHITSSGKHLLRLINDILDLSKVESGTFEYFPERVDLHSLIEDTVATLRPSMLAQSVQVKIHIDPDLTDVDADPARLKQSLYNYLSNAIKFSSRGGHVHVQAMPEGADRFRVEVIDFGIGIPDGGIAKLFVPFQQLDAGANRRHQGTGLGLALTRQLVEAQGGSVGARSNFNEGSTFYLVLPRKGKEIRAALDVQSDGRKAAMPHLLVVDEDDEERADVSRQGTDAGFIVASANEDEAFALATSHLFDAVALSVFVKEDVGLKLLNAVRVKSGEDPVTVIVVPTRPLTALRANDILTKPLDIKRLTQVLDRLGVLRKADARLLVIDDDPHALTLMQALLETMNVQADFVDSATTALEYIENKEPDGILLDLMMPTMNGFQFLAELRQNTLRNAVPVVIWTGMTLNEADRTRLLQCYETELPSENENAGVLPVVLKEAAAISARRRA